MIALDRFVHAIYSAMTDANHNVAQRQQALLDAYFEPTEADATKLRPKTVVVQYPRETSTGMVVHDVHVPLITLVPISSLRIERLHLMSRLEVVLDKDDEIQVSFQPYSPESAEDSAGLNWRRRGSATLEIELTPATLPEGLKSLIEGYERALRAQIPG